MKLVKYNSLDSFRVERTGYDSIKVREGSVYYYEGANTNVIIPELEVFDMEAGTYHLWLKQTWEIAKKMLHLLVNGTTGVGKVFYWDYRNPTFEYLFLEDGSEDTIPTYTRDSEITFIKLADIVVDRTITISNQYTGSFIIPRVRRYHWEGTGD